MKRLRVLGLLLAAALLSGLLGCDVALVDVLVSKNKSKPSNAAPAPNVSYNLWVAELGAITGSAEEGTLRGNHGDPDAKWTLLASPTTSVQYTMPTPTGGGFDAILIQATANQVYDFDAFEIIDATGTTLQTAAGGTIFSSLDVVPTILDAQGPPNGKGALTAASSTDRSFVFMKRATPITTFRVNLWGQGLARVSGDVEWVRTHVRVGDQQAGGAATMKNGSIYLSIRDGSTLFMLRFDSDGNVILDSPANAQLTTLETTIPSVGSAAIAIDQANDDVFVATTKNLGDIALYKYVGNSQLPSWSFPALSGSGVDRVEPNGLALNSAGELILAGGVDSGVPNGINHYLRKHSKVNGADMWVAASPAPPSPPLDTGNTYWYAVATDAIQSIFTTGDITLLVVVGNLEGYTSKIVDTNTSSSNGGVTEAWNDRSRGSNTAPARGQAIGVDGNHNVYVAGFCTGTGLDSFILQYDGAISPPFPAPVGFFTLSRTGNDEFLDIVVEPDGTVYATGYETNGA